MCCIICNISGSTIMLFTNLRVMIESGGIFEECFGPNGFRYDFSAH